MKPLSERRTFTLIYLCVIFFPTVSLIFSYLMNEETQLRNFNLRDCAIRKAGNVGITGRVNVRLICSNGEFLTSINEKMMDKLEKKEPVKEKELIFLLPD